MIINFRLVYVFVLCLMATMFAGAQSKGKGQTYFSEPILTDSVSTIMIPTVYAMELFASDKALSWGNYYANFVVYNFATDSYFHLFPENTYIKAFNTRDYYSLHLNPPESKLKNVSRDWIFYIVKPSDYNGDKKMDEKDPNILYVSSRKGEGLKAISPPNENVVSFTIYEKQGFALVHLQQDMNHDRDFQDNDKSFTMMKLDLSTLQWSNKIEINRQQP